MLYTVMPPHARPFSISSVCGVVRIERNKNVSRCLSSQMQLFKLGQVLDCFLNIPATTLLKCTTDQPNHFQGFPLIIDPFP